METYLDTIAYVFVYVAGTASVYIGGAYIAVSFIYAVVYQLSMVLRAK